MKKLKIQMVSKILDTSNDTIRRASEECGTEVERQETGPKTRLFTYENVYDIASSIAAKKKRQKINKDKRPVLMTVYAPKGGVGKTTLASNLACLFPLLGYKTLVIDLDFQANLTMSFDYDSELTIEEAEEMDVSKEKIIEYHFGHLLKDWPTGTKTFAEVVKKPYGENGPHLIPADLNLDQLDATLTVASLSQGDGDFKIAEYFEENFEKNGVLSSYDLIIFDAAPAKNRITRNALFASDYVISPISMEKFSTKGLSYLSVTLDQMNRKYKRSPLLIVVGNFYTPKRTRVLHQLTVVKSSYVNHMIGCYISRSEDFPKALGEEFSAPVVLSKPFSESVKQINAVAKEILDTMKPR